MTPSMNLEARSDGHVDSYGAELRKWHITKRERAVKAEVSHIFFCRRLFQNKVKCGNISGVELWLGGTQVST